MPRKAAPLLFALLLAAWSVPTEAVAAEAAVPVEASPVPAFDEDDPSQAVFGGLRFLGGIEVDSPDDRFGGLSGIEISGDGRKALLVGDNGDLFSATLDYDDGILAGLSDVAAYRLIGADGKPLGDKESSDAESLRALGGNGLSDGGVSGDFLIGFERDNRILQVRVDDNGAPVTAKRLALPDAVAALPENKGLEGIAVIPPGAPNGGAIVTFAESIVTEEPDVIPGWMIRDGETRDLGLKRTSDFNLTDIVALPDGDLIVLERYFSIFSGVAMRLRRISAAALDGPQPMEATTLLTAGSAREVDNMEGVAVHTDAQGRTVLTIISDDNFNLLQRTLILQFELL
ncbi:esterase-like activity of phytase family protein [Microbaculum sp. FT89]|uniref:esterase-like activity of phytase family protein n=1 Tax=Microbaculum sp. FT89 TaxID=3447298 RepID=UPI003F52B662